MYDIHESKEWYIGLVFWWSKIFSLYSDDIIIQNMLLQGSLNRNRYASSNINRVHLFLKLLDFMQQ